jgi:hypothetical protein
LKTSYGGSTPQAADPPGSSVARATHRPGMPPGFTAAVSGRSLRPGLAMRRDDQGDDHQERGSRKYQDYGGDAHEDPVLACPSLPVLQRESGPGRTIARGRIVQVDPPASARANRATKINHDVSRLSQTRPACAAAGELDSCWAELLRVPGLRTVSRSPGGPRCGRQRRVAAGSGPSGVMRPVQLATASTMPATASTLARADGGRGGRWYGMSWVLLSSRIRMRWRCGRCCLGAGGVRGD